MNRMRNNNINLGDRVFARLTLGGRTIVEFMINCVNNTEELMAELYRITKGIRGLAKLYIRNQSKGWAEERAVMLYADSPAPLQSYRQRLPPPQECISYGNPTDHIRRRG